MKELPLSAPYQFTFNSQKRDKTYIINQLQDRPSTQHPPSECRHTKTNMDPWTWSCPSHKNPSLVCQACTHRVLTDIEGKCESSLPCFNTKDNGWLGGSLHLYFLPPVFHPVNGTAITSGRRQQMVVSVQNGLLVSTKTFVANVMVLYINCTGISKGFRTNKETHFHEDK